MRVPTLLPVLLASFTLFAHAAPQAKPKGKPKAPVAKSNGHTALYDHVMKKYDVNKNKKLDDKERIKIREAHDADDFMAGKLDTNGNNVVDAAEFAALENEKPVKTSTPAKPASPTKKKKK